MSRKAPIFMYKADALTHTTYTTRIGRRTMATTSVSGMRRALSTGAPLRLSVTRPCPIPNTEYRMKC